MKQQTFMRIIEKSFIITVKLYLGDIYNNNDIFECFIFKKNFNGSKVKISCRLGITSNCMRKSYLKNIPVHQKSIKIIKLFKIGINKAQN